MILISFLISLSVVASVTFLSNKYNLFVDKREGVQNINELFVSRLGGFSIFISLFIIAMIDDNVWLLNFLFLSLPLFFVGVWEDTMHGVSAWIRLITLFIVAYLLIWSFHVKFQQFGIWFLDVALNEIPYIWMILTVIILAGFSNAFNIIDGFNGLMLGHTFTMLVVLFFVGNAVGMDYNYLRIIQILIGAFLGIFILNFPFGFIFSGDLGAYFSGLIVSFLTIWLINFNAVVHPTFLFLLLFYPGFEILFSFIRKIIEKKSPMSPDNKHFHLLLYQYVRNKKYIKYSFLNNIIVSFLLYVVFLPLYIFVSIYFDDRLVLLSLFFIYSALYLCVYWMLRKEVL